MIDSVNLTFSDLHALMRVEKWYRAVHAEICRDAQTLEQVLECINGISIQELQLTDVDKKVRMRAKGTIYGGEFLVAPLGTTPGENGIGKHVDMVWVNGETLPHVHDLYDTYNPAFKTHVHGVPAIFSLMGGSADIFTFDERHPKENAHTTKWHRFGESSIPSLVQVDAGVAHAFLGAKMLAFASIQVGQIVPEEGERKGQLNTRDACEFAMGRFRQGPVEPIMLGAGKMVESMRFYL